MFFNILRQGIIILNMHLKNIIRQNHFVIIYLKQKTHAVLFIFDKIYIHIYTIEW